MAQRRQRDFEGRREFLLRHAYLLPDARHVNQAETEEYRRLQATLLR
jgi:hypothetical protein